MIDNSDANNDPAADRPKEEAAADGSAMEPSAVAAVRVMSFSFARGPFPFPGADIVLDLRSRFSYSSAAEPDDITDVTGLTACGPCAQVDLQADGVAELVEGVVPLVAAFRSGTGDEPVTVAVGCTSGRLSATVATAMHRRMNGLVLATVEHLALPDGAEPRPGTTPAAPQDPPSPPPSAGADGPQP